MLGRCWAPCALVALIATGCGGHEAVTVTPARGWTQFRLNPQHNAVLPGTLRVTWRLETHGGFSSSPSVAGSTMYIGNNRGVLYAINVRTGRPRWTFHVTAPLMSNPLVYDGFVIVGEGDQQYSFGNNRLFVGGPENWLVAIDAITGQRRWQVPLAGSGMPTPAIIDGLLVQHNGRGYLIAVEPNTGEVRYTVDLKSAAAMTAILPLEHDAFATAGGLTDSVQKRTASTGQRIWETAFPNGAWGMSDCPPATDGKSIFCNYNGPPPGVSEGWHVLEPAVEHAWAIDARTGRLRWDVRLTAGRIPDSPPRIGTNQGGIPLIVADTLYCGGSVAPYVYALATGDGAVRWRLRVHGPVKSGPVEKNGVLYFGDLRGYLWAVDAGSGKPIGSKNMHTPFNVGSPIIDGNTLLVGSKSGSIIAIPLDEIRSAHDG